MTEDGQKAFNAIAAKDTTALTKYIMRYAKQSERSDARVNELGACIEAMVMQPQPLGWGLLPYVAGYAKMQCTSHL